MNAMLLNPQRVAVQKHMGASMLLLKMSHLADFSTAHDAILLLSVVLWSASQCRASKPNSATQCHWAALQTQAYSSSASNVCACSTAGPRVLHNGKLAGHEKLPARHCVCFCLQSSTCGFNHMLTLQLTPLAQQCFPLQISGTKLSQEMCIQFLRATSTAVLLIS